MELIRLLFRGNLNFLHFGLSQHFLLYTKGNQSGLVIWTPKALIKFPLGDAGVGKGLGEMLFNNDSDFRQSSGKPFYRNSCFN